MTASTRCPGRNRVVPRVEALEERALLTAGALDANFGTGGQRVLPALGNGDEVARSVLVQPNKMIVVAGFTEDSTQGVNLRVTRLTSTGEPDPEFGGGSRVVDILAPVNVDVNQLTDQTVLLALQSDGQILVGSSHTRNGSDVEFVVRRLNARDGSTDTSFGTLGTARVDFNVPGGTGEDRLRAMVVDDQGRIVLAGNVNAGGASGAHAEVGVARLSRDGVLDDQFGTGGLVNLPLGRGSAGVTAVALQGSRILVAGYDLADTATSASDFGVVCLGDRGRLDTTFGQGGKQLLDVGGTSRLDRAGAMAVQPWDGKVVLAGYSEAGGGGYDFSVVRLDSGGQPDPGFGDGGKKIIQFSNNFTTDRATSVLIQSDQKIVVAGFNQLVRNVSDFGFAVARLQADGRPDTSFGSDGGKRSFTFTRGGAVQGDPNRTDDKAFAAALQADGKVVLVGHFALNAQGREQFAVARLEGDPLPPSQPPGQPTPQPPGQPAPQPPAQSPPPPSVLGIAGPFVVKVRKAALFQALLSDPGAANAVFCFWMVTVGSGRKLRLVGSGVGPAFNFLPTARGSYTVTLYAGSGTTHTFAVRV